MMQFQSFLRRFWRDDRGNAIVEAVFFLPVLLVAWVGIFAFWEVFSARSAVQKAGYAAADLLSRQMVPVSGATLDGLDKAVEYLVGPRFDVTTRFTHFTRTGPLDTDVAVNWSYSTETQVPVLATPDLVAMAGQLPKLSVGSAGLLVQTDMAYRTPFAVPIVNYVVPEAFADAVVLRPRYVPKLCWEGAATC